MGGDEVIEISHDVRAAGDGIAQRHALPPVPAGAVHEPSLVERIGKGVRDRLPAIGAIGLVGGIAGSLAIGRSPLARLGGGIVGAVAGAALAVVGATLLPGSDRLDRAGSVQAPTDAVASEDVRVMTVNLRGGLGRENLGRGNLVPDPRRHLSAIAEQIRREQPDVVLFQEFDDRHARSLFMDELDWFVDELRPDDAVYGQPDEDLSGMLFKVGGQSVMTFNGFTIDNARELWSRDQDKYGTMDTLVRTPGGSVLRAMSTHQHGDAFAQLDELAGSIGAWRGPTVFAGDFNRESDSPRGRRETEILSGVDLHDAFLDVGIEAGDSQRDSFRSGTDIDRFALSPHFTAERVEVLDEGPWHSDHRAVVADLRLGPTAGSRG